MRLTDSVTFFLVLSSPGELSASSELVHPPLEAGGTRVVLDNPALRLVAFSFISALPDRSNTEHKSARSASPFD